MLDGRASFCLMVLCTSISLLSENVLCDIPAPRSSLVFSPQTDTWSVFVNISRFTSVCVDDYKGVNYSTLYPKTYLTDSAV